MGWIWTAALNGGLGVAGYGVAAYGFRQPPGWPRALAAVLLAWVWLTVGMEALGPFGLLSRGPLLGWVAVGLLAAWVCRYRNRGRDPERTGHGSDGSAPTAAAAWTREEILAVAVVVWAAALAGALSLVLPVKVVSDGPIYHLYFAARWWKAGRLGLIAAPFGENAATYFPAVGDLWFCWLMIGWGGDRLARVGQAPFLLLSALAAFATCRRLGAGRPASVVAVAWFVTCTPYFLFSFEANVDTVLVAGYLLACYFFLRYALGDDGVASLGLGALAAGGSLASKAPGVVFVPPLLALAAGLAVWRGRGPAGKGLGVLTVALAPFVPAGYWWGQNLRLTGNPLYPLHLSAFGRVWLAGWYGPEVMRLSQYYIPFGDWRSFADIMLLVADPRLAPVWGAAVAGVWALGAEARPPLDRWVWVASALAVANVALFWALIPYRSQYRFMYQGIGLAAVPLARAFDRGRLPLRLGVALLFVHAVTACGWPFDAENPPWDFNPYVPPSVVPLIHTLPTSLTRLRGLDTSPVTLLPVVLTVVLGASAVGAVWACARASERPTPRRLAGVGLWAAWLVAVALTLVYPWGADAREMFFARFEDFHRGWLALDVRSGPNGAKVAYAGTDLPYFLMGVGLRNEVRYVNVDAHRDWLMHDYHLAARADRSRPATWPAPRPGWDRARPDYDAWLANLRAEGIQLLVVTRANPAHGAHNIADDQGFPVERVWADAHPEVFEPVYGAAERDRLFRLYRVKPAAGS